MMKGNIESDLNMALDELNLRNVKVENGGWFGEKLDRKVRKKKLFNIIFIMIKFIYFYCSSFEIICVYSLCIIRSYMVAKVWVRRNKF
jgi:hypothetical protein